MDGSVDPRGPHGEVLDGSGDPQGGPGRVGGPAERSGTGRVNLEDVRDRLEEPWGGPGRIGGPSGEIRDGSGDPR